jgi:Family of unknown function (DUF6114)
VFPPTPCSPSSSAAICGFLLWFHPEQRVFYSILAVVLSLGTWITSNLGGFVVGLVLGIAGASLAFGWQVPKRTTEKSLPH